MQQVQEENHSHPLDRSGIAISALCLAHCLAGPLLVLAIPAWESFEDQSSFHRIVALLILAVGTLAFYKGYKHHRQTKVVWTALLGFVVVAIGLFQSTHDHALGALSKQSLFMILGSACLIAAHVWNIRSCEHKHC